jgi:hypothetical protein
MFSRDPYTILIGDESHQINEDYYRLRTEPFDVRKSLKKKGNVNRDKIKAARKQKNKKKK